MRINPCHACPNRNGCYYRETLRKKASGTGARSISYDCELLGHEMRIGRRILIETVILQPSREFGDGFIEYGRSWHKVKATITARSGYYRFACVVDPGQITEDDVAEGVDINKIRFRRTMRHTRIVAFLNEDDACICDCGNVVKNGKCDTPNGECVCNATPHKEGNHERN